MKENWKQLPKEWDEDLDGAYAFPVMDGKSQVGKWLWQVSWNHNDERWEFYDRNGTEVREVYDGEPTHYLMINE